LIPLLFLIDLGFGILDFGFKVFYQFNKKQIERSDTINPPSKIHNPK
jgi:hypothetical protein